MYIWRYAVASMYIIFNLFIINKKLDKDFAILQVPENFESWATIYVLVT